MTYKVKVFCISEFQMKFNTPRPRDFWNTVYKYTYIVQKLNKCASSHFLLPGSTIDQVLCAAPFFSLAVPPDIHLIYHGFECSITTGLFTFSGIIIRLLPSTRFSRLLIIYILELCWGFTVPSV